VADNVRRTVDAVARTFLDVEDEVDSITLGRETPLALGARIEVAEALEVLLDLGFIRLDHERVVIAAEQMEQTRRRHQMRRQHRPADEGDAGERDVVHLYLRPLGDVEDDLGIAGLIALFEEALREGPALLVVLGDDALTGELVAGRVEWLARANAGDLGQI